MGLKMREWGHSVCNVCYLAHLIHCTDQYDSVCDWELPQKYFVCEAENCDERCRLHSQHEG